MGLTELTLEACPCARIGSSRAKLVLRTHPEVDSCRTCSTPIWVTRAGRESELDLICWECLEAGVTTECEAGPEPYLHVALKRLRVFFRFIGRRMEGLWNYDHRIGPCEAWEIATLIHPWEPGCRIFHEADPELRQELLPPPF